VIQKDVADDVVKMLETVVERGGTGLHASVPHYRVAGKTGTAQAPQDKTHAWFTAFGPYNNPDLVIVVLVEDGGEGSAVAAPIAGDIFDWCQFLT